MTDTNTIDPELEAERAAEAGLPVPDAAQVRGPDPVRDYQPAFLVLTLGNWGRGSTLRDAALACRKAGGRSDQCALAYVVLGDDKPCVTSDGYIESAYGSRQVNLGMFSRLSNLTTMKEGK